MMYVRSCMGRVILPVLLTLVATSPSISNAEVQSAQVLIKEVKGAATYATSVGGKFKSLHNKMTLTHGAVIKTGADGIVDLMLSSSKTALRLRPNSELRLDKLTQEPGGEAVITESSLNLVSGSIVGVQRKLAAPSKFQIKMGGGVATIVGTEYLVRADGAVTVLSGSVEVNFNLPGGGGSIHAIIPAGYSFDPATGQVVPTSPAFLQNIIADVETTKQNAMSFKVGGANVVVKAEKEISPTTAP